MQYPISGIGHYNVNPAGKKKLRELYFVSVLFSGVSRKQTLAIAVGCENPAGIKYCLSSESF